MRLWGTFLKTTTIFPHQFKTSIPLKFPHAYCPSSLFMPPSFYLKPYNHTWLYSYSFQIINSAFYDNLSLKRFIIEVVKHHTKFYSQYQICFVHYQNQKKICDRIKTRKTISLYHLKWLMSITCIQSFLIPLYLAFLDLFSWSHIVPKCTFVYIYTYTIG